MTGVETLIDRDTGLEYRIVPGEPETNGDAAVVVMHGGHMHANIKLGEAVFQDLGYTILVPSRPGYGSTPIMTSGGMPKFVDAVASLVVQHGCRSVAAVVGISAGGPSAIEMAVRHPALVQRVVLENSVSSLPWPDRLTMFAGRIVFSPVVEAATWAMIRAALRRAPIATLRSLLTPLTTKRARDVIDELSLSDRDAMVDLFASMRSGHGFRQDLDSTLSRSSLDAVIQPALILASEHDGSVPLQHADDLHRHISRSRLVVTDTSSHLMWFGPKSESVDAAIRRFLDQTS